MVVSGILAMGLVVHSTGAAPGPGDRGPAYLPARDLYRKPSVHRLPGR